MIKRNINRALTQLKDQFHLMIYGGQTDEKYKTAKVLVQIFYFIQLAVAYQAFTFNSQLPDWTDILRAEEMFMPLWPVQWVKLVNYSIACKGILLSFLIASFISTLFWTRHTIIRAISFLSFFFYLALISSFGKIDHYLHLMLVMSFFLVLLPKSNKSVEGKTAFLKVFWFVQLFALTTYSISGLFKFYGIADQLIRGQISAIDPTAFGQNIAKSLFHTGKPPFLSEMILHNPSYFFSIILVAGYLIELAAIFFAFLPRWHRLIGSLLILLHIGIGLTVGADFLYQILVVGILFLYSPFENKATV